MNLLKFQWRIYFRPLCTHSTVTKQHFGVHHSIWTGKEMNDVSSFIVYGYKKRGSSFQKPTCLFPASRFCLTRFTLWNMHEAEPDTERSCSDVSFRPCNTSWPDICKKKKKKENPCEHTHKWLLSLKGTEQADVCQSVLSNYGFPVASTARRLLCCCCFQISSGKNTSIFLLSGCRMSQRRRVWAQVSGRTGRLDCTQVESAAVM